MLNDRLTNEVALKVTEKIAGLGGMLTKDLIEEASPSLGKQVLRGTAAGLGLGGLAYGAGTALGTDAGMFNDINNANNIESDARSQLAEMRPALHLNQQIAGKPTDVVGGMLRANQHLTHPLSDQAGTLPNPNMQSNMSNLVDQATGRAGIPALTDFASGISQADDTRRAAEAAAQAAAIEKAKQGWLNGGAATLDSSIANYLNPIVNGTLNTAKSTKNNIIMPAVRDAEATLRRRAQAAADANAGTISQGQPDFFGTLGRKLHNAGDVLGDTTLKGVHAIQNAVNAVHHGVTILSNPEARDQIDFAIANLMQNGKDAAAKYLHDTYYRMRYNTVNEVNNLGNKFVAPVTNGLSHDYHNAINYVGNQAHELGQDLNYGVQQAESAPRRAYNYVNQGLGRFFGM